MYQVSHPLRRHLWLFLCLLVAGLLLLPQTAHAEDNLTIVTEADLAPGGKINGTNWMSGISGERRLHEITMPGTHDTGMANAKAATLSSTPLPMPSKSMRVRRTWVSTTNLRQALECSICA